MGSGSVLAGRGIAYAQRSETVQDTTEVRANTTAACLSAPGNVTCRREAQFRFAQDEVGATAIGEAAAGERHHLVFGAEWSRIETEEMRDGRQANLNTGVTTNVVGTDVFPMRDFPKSRVERIGAFVQDEVALPFGSLIPALRFDRFEMEPRVDDVYAAANPGRTPVGLTDSAWSPKLGALVPLGAGVTLSLQAATGFRTPPYFDVNVGLSVMQALGLDWIPVISLAKQQEEVYVGESPQPLALDPTSPALHTLQKIRDEAHRFAITYHKKLRQKRTLTSVLDQIPGVGPTLRTNLLRTLGSARRVREASVAELASVPKVTPKLAQRIHEFFHPALATTPVEVAEAPAEPAGGAAAAADEAG